ncbi:hypothetical protein, conserved [Plasmodium gonderi]|uniref:Uncharacterized protein n=1 Tax=Plasmodium gonderi TaxID=77519 RepID=A0A1Y1JFU4_PLAGO|nr:hypothetical protein, conserved [Plasmodium gonderi]GAW79303.1 hypothetical protein, conserved [Plasmodium gonderi]
MKTRSTHTLLSVVLSLFLLKNKVLTLQLYASDVKPIDMVKGGNPNSSPVSSFATNTGMNLGSKSIPNNIFDTDTQFNESLKTFLKSGNGGDETSGSENLKGENFMGEKFLEENKEFIKKQILSDLYSKFIVDVVNNSTLSFLENLNSEKTDKNEFQIELEESCSPFFCEKVMKAKEVEAFVKPSDISTAGTETNQSIETDKQSKNNASSEKNIKMHDGIGNVSEDVVQNLDNVMEGANNQNDIEGIFSHTIDGNEEKQKIILTDGDNVYVLEEISQGNDLLNDEDLNKQSSFQEIKMHVPNESKGEVDEKNKDLLESILNTSDENVDSATGEVNNIQMGSEKGIRQHDLTKDYSNFAESNNSSNEMNNIDENIFTMSEEELSKKIFDDIKMNSEDKVECYNFSNDENKCNSYKKCTFVNIDNKDTCFLDYNYMLFLKNNNCALQPKSSLLSISKDLLKNEIINRQMFQMLRNSNNNNFICDTITYSFLTNVVDNTNYEEIFS